MRSAPTDVFLFVTLMTGSTSQVGKPTLAFFYSPTSGPSRRVEALLAQVLQRRQNHRTFFLRRINCVEHPQLAKRFKVTIFPTLVVIENRRICARLEGRLNASQIEQLLEPWLERIQ